MIAVTITVPDFVVGLVLGILLGVASVLLFGLLITRPTTEAKPPPEEV